MNKKLTTLAMILLASSSYAKSPLFLDHQAIPKSNSVSNATNFSGNWLGKCTGGDTQEITISQNDFHINLSIKQEDKDLSTSYYLDGQMTQSGEIGQYSEKELRQALWDKEHSSLMLHTVFSYMAGNGNDQERKYSYSSIATVATILSIKNNKLHIHYDTFLSSSGEKEASAESIDCIYEKK